MSQDEKKPLHGNEEARPAESEATLRARVLDMINGKLDGIPVVIVLDTGKAKQTCECPYREDVEKVRKFMREIEDQVTPKG